MNKVLLCNDARIFSIPKIREQTREEYFLYLFAWILVKNAICKGIMSIIIVLGISQIRRVAKRIPGDI